MQETGPDTAAPPGVAGIRMLSERPVEQREVWRMLDAIDGRLGQVFEALEGLDHGHSKLMEQLAPIVDVGKVDSSGRPSSEAPKIPANTPLGDRLAGIETRLGMIAERIDAENARTGLLYSSVQV